VKVLLEMQEVRKSYGRGKDEIPVLRGITLNVEIGEVVWIRGRSGSGKSSLLRVAGLLSTPDDGRVAVNGLSPRSQKIAADIRRDKIGFVFQSSNLIPELTVLDNILIAGCKISADSVRRLLGDMGLQHLENRQAKTVSGGEAQRIAFCRALIKDPQLLLVDEPTSGLDSHHTEAICAALSSARSRGRGILVASHDEAIGPVTDRSISMEAGQIV
jgi:ABC-type lipoprotein export system ATPase subunit